MKRRGWFITFEGPEGSGKSTQIQTAAKFLTEKGYAVVLLREPGGTRISEAIRKILLDKKNTEMTCVAELLLYLAARAQIVREKIEPELKKGKVVICDRFEDSTFAYQGYGRKIPLQLIRAISELVRRDLKPELTFVLDIDSWRGLKRGGRHDRIEKESLVFHHRVRRGFLSLAKKNPKRMILLDTSKPVGEVAQQVRERLERVFGQ
ncbi:MAG: dTMP kinase [Candidatus Omnitrophota bacterium]